MILAIKDGQFHKINSPVKVVEIIQNDNHPLVRTWMVKDAIAKHRKLFGWKLIEEKKQESVKSNSRINQKKLFLQQKGNKNER